MIRPPVARFQPGGTLRPGDALYVERPADRELPDALLRGEFCYVLGPRQIGKSSLRVRAMRRLEAQGVRCASVDLTTIGRGESPEVWYFSLMDELARALRLETDPGEFWQRHAGRTPVYRWFTFLREEV